jgi:glycosyltransferase involved in cell wall biosynthesis
MDALFLGWNRLSLYRYGISPNKLMDYMMAAKPVIHAVEAGNDPVSESGCGISCAPEDPEAIARAVLDLMRRCTPEERSAMGQRGKDYVLQHHSYATLASQFLEVMA